MTLQRYMGFGGAMIPNGDGKWVKAAEAEAEIVRLQAENDRLRAALTTVVAYFDGRCDVDLKKIASDALKGGDE